VHGFYIEVTQRACASVPDDYRRRQTLKNAERYITPELKTFEDKALSAQERALAREKLLYDALLDALARRDSVLQRVGLALATLDVLCAQAERADTLRLVQPSSCEPAIDDRRRPPSGGRAQVDDFVANDVVLGADRGC
jgi:DNA mismatch repair protein MutS